ncbi:skin secretory protein xP2-like [Scyliorhinus canicula]|uniref:skin secretory protein xP2-like n=1 Tax=Scyliorhinus canicula TaxID=7830 RepID=UPI0018F753FB|nr:skin secretory protein xP2-like [Scyliorhinus canicula]
MSLSLEAVPLPQAHPPEAPLPSPTPEEKRPPTVASPTAHHPLQVHPAAGTLSLPAEGQHLGPTQSGSTATSLSSGSEVAKDALHLGDGAPQSAESQGPARSAAQSGLDSTPLAPTEPSSGRGSSDAASPARSSSPAPGAPSETEVGPPRSSPLGANAHQPITSHSAPTVLDEEKPRSPPALGSPPPPPPPDIWKTPFWIIEDFQAPCQVCRRREEEQAAPRPADSAVSAGAEPGLRVSQQPPYYDLEPEDLASYVAIHPGPEPCVRDSELMDIPDEDWEFWGQFYFAGVDTARDLIRQRRRPHRGK